jgi:hypothetical protein
MTLKTGKIKIDKKTAQSLAKLCIFETLTSALAKIFAEDAEEGRKNEAEEKIIDTCLKVSKETRKELLSKSLPKKSNNNNKSRNIPVLSRFSHVSQGPKIGQKRKREDSQAPRTRKVFVGPDGKMWGGPSGCFVCGCPDHQIRDCPDPRKRP